MINMKLIAHRGNVLGPDAKRENTESYILEALSLGYDCEIDIWIIDKHFFLGHDEPLLETTAHFLHTYKNSLWIHCKNSASLEYFVKHNYNCFYHDKDNYTLTSHGYVWGNINSIIIKDMICVMPEKYTFSPSHSDLIECLGICSDFIQNYTQL